MSAMSAQRRHLFPQGTPPLAKRIISWIDGNSQDVYWENSAYTVNPQSGIGAQHMISRVFPAHDVWTLWLYIRCN